MGFDDSGATASGRSRSVDVTIVMPCLDEALCLPTCLSNAREALVRMQRELGLEGEIVVADNGSTDGSQELARGLGARVVSVAERGYGAALRGGAMAAQGRYIVMGDADGSYDFCDAVAMVEALTKGADMCIGSRFKGGIKPGAMPWKNRVIGNPVLTGVLNLLFGTRISDAHCGLRALSRGCFGRLGLCGSGMEFASEMIIKAALKGETIAEVPATLSPDLRDRPPHLRPWRDGWRHLRYLMMLSPTWAFAVPAVVLGVVAIFVLGTASIMSLRGVERQNIFFGNYWVILAGAMLGVSHLSALLAAATHLYGAREGYRLRRPWTTGLARWVSLETMVLIGIMVGAAGLLTLFVVVGYWSAHRFEAMGSVLPPVIGTSRVTIGLQNIFGGFLLAILSGKEAAFLKDGTAPRMTPSGAEEMPLLAQEAPRRRRAK